MLTKRAGESPLGSREDEAVERPQACPACQSKAVGTLAKSITAATYWRCQACGEVWNVGRRRSASSGPRSRFTW